MEYSAGPTHSLLQSLVYGITHSYEIHMLYCGDSGSQSLAKSVLKCKSNSEVAQSNKT